jgi:hypothetical protein
MRVRLMGQIQAVDGVALAPAGPTQRRVLAGLALRHAEIVDVTAADLANPLRPAPARHRREPGVHTIRPWLSWWFVSERSAIGIAQNVSVDGRGGR